MAFLWLAGPALATGIATFVHPKLGEDSYSKLRLLVEEGAAEVQLHVVCRPGWTAAVAAAIVQRGGQVRFRSDTIDYLRIAWPFAGVASVESLADLDGIQAIAASYSGARPSAAQRQLTVDLNPKMSGEPALPLTDPHLVLSDVDGEALRRESPTFDGRGVTIGHIEESMPDLLHPQLQHALDLQGELVPKFTQATILGDSQADRDRLWIQMKEIVRSVHGQFSWNGKTYLAPRDGLFRFGLLSRPVMSSYGIATPVPGRDNQQAVVFPILWDEHENEVWVDTNANDSFRDERGLHPYHSPEDIGVFGVDDPATLRRETLGFTVTIDADHHAIHLNPGWGGHASLTAGAAAGEGYGNGRFDALAGKARLAYYGTSSVWDSYTAIEAADAALRDPAVDLAFFECDSRQYSGYRVKDGTNALTVALDRLSQNTHKLIFVPGGNAYGTDLITELSAGDHLISVQAYDSRDMLRGLSQIETMASDNLHSVGSFGPADDGALKPDLMAPAAQVSIEPEFFHLGGPRRFPGKWELPYGVSIGGGTSCATPTAAAAAALVISAAKQTGIAHDADRLRTALFSSARFCAGLHAYQQGRGLIQVGSAWQMLKYLDRQKNWVAPQIEVIAPVRSTNSDRLRTPHKGRGLFEREGWTAGDTGTRTITFIRRNGPADPVTYDFEWLGDSSSFSTDSRNIRLPLNTPVELPVHIQTPDARTYSAILRLKPTGEPYEAKAILLTAVAAVRPVAEKTKSLTRELSVSRPGVESLFVDVPVGTKRMIVKAAKGNEELLTLFVHPPNMVLSTMTSKLFWVRDGEKEVSIDNPVAGVWEIYVNNRAMLLDDASLPLMSDPTLRANMAQTGLRETLEPRPVPLTPTAVRITISVE